VVNGEWRVYRCILLRVIVDGVAVKFSNKKFRNLNDTCFTDRYSFTGWFYRLLR
jgi:hypothetical protein